MIDALSLPDGPDHGFRRVAIVFAGGPAPAANAVISTAAISFLRNGIEVIGIFNGYANLADYSSDRPLREGEDYIVVDDSFLNRSRNSQGVVIGTSRRNPGMEVIEAAHIEDEGRCASLRAVCEGLASLDVEALVSIGGDDTLKTANKLLLYQQHAVEESRRIPVVHVPKTIDNDYPGIDFTFGYFTTVHTLAAEITNLLHDAEACRSYFVVEAMGRSAGWLAYGAAIAGEASMVISHEDIAGKYLASEPYEDPQTGESGTRSVMDVPLVVKRIVRLMRARKAEGKPFGVVVLSEALAELLPLESLEGIPRDEHGHLRVAAVEVGRMFAGLVSDAYEEATGEEMKVRPVQLGYEARCAKPHAFDVMLGSQLGVGAYRALVEERLNGVMVSVRGQLELYYVPFSELVDPQTLVTTVRRIEVGGDLHRLARFLETSDKE